MMPLQPLAPADTVAYIFADLAIILIVARIVGTVFEKLKQPRIVGEIIAGILIGPTVLGGNLGKAAMPNPDGGMPIPGVQGTGLVDDLYPVQAFAFLNLIGQVALVFFMFLVGLELEKRYLRGKGTQMTVVALAVVLVPVGLGFLAITYFNGAPWQPEGVSDTTFALFLGAGIATTAFPVMARILQEKGMLGTNMGAVGVGSAAIVTVLMFLVIAAASASAKNSGIVDSVGVKFLLIAGLTVGLFVIVRPLLKLAIDRMFDAERDLDGNLLGLLLAGALATALATDRILGVGLVGGFLFGLAVPNKAGLAQAVIARMTPAVVVFFLPVFLAVSGLRTDLTLINGEILVGALIFLVLMILGKWIAGYVAGRAVGLGNADAHAIGALMNCRGLLILVVALIGLQLQVITPQTQLLFVIGAIITTLMTGPLVDKFLTPEKVRRDSANLSPEDLELAREQSQGTAVISA